MGTTLKSSTLASKALDSLSLDGLEYTGPHHGTLNDDWTLTFDGHLDRRERENRAESYSENLWSNATIAYHWAQYGVDVFYNPFDNSDSSFPVPVGIVLMERRTVRNPVAPDWCWFDDSK